MTETPPVATDPAAAQPEGRFDAFISYKRSDIAFARLLDKALNAYVPPKTLDVPQRRLRAFRDEGDLTGPEYFAAIDGFLARSDHLIVICSPAARASPFVNDEIRRFVKHRGAQYIVPVLLSGVPNNEAGAGAAEAAFPDALIEALALPLAVEYRGFDPQREKLRRGRFEGSWYTLLANLYGRSRDEIEQRERVRQRRQRNLWIGLGAAVSLTLASLAIVAWWQKLQADEQRNAALRGLSRYLVKVAQETQNRPQDAVLLAVEAVRTTRDVDGTVTPEAQNALRAALSRISGEPLGGLGGQARGVRFNSTGAHAAAERNDGTVEAWETATGRRLLFLPAAPGRALHAISPDGRWVVLGEGTPRELVLQPVGEPAPAAVRLGARSGPGESPLGFSDDGRWLATGDDAARVRLWSLAEPDTPPRVLEGHIARRGHDGKPLGVTHAAFSPTADWLFTSGWDGAGLMWNLAEATPAPTRLPDADGRATGTFSPDGRWFVQRTGDRYGQRAARLALWRLDGGAWSEADWPMGEPAAPATGKADPPPPGSAIGFVDAPLRLLVQQPAEVEVWKLGAALQAEQRVPGVLGTASRDGRWLVVATQARDDKGPTLRLHDLREPGAAARELLKADTPLKALHLDATGRFLALQPDKGPPQFVDLAERDPQPRPLSGQDSATDTLRFSADGRWLLGTAVWGDFSVRRWRLENPGTDPVTLDTGASQELMHETTSGGGGEPVAGLPDALSIAPDGRRLALPGPKGEVWLVGLDDPAAAPQVLKGPSRQVTATAFTPDGRQLLAADWDHGVHVWTLAEPSQPPQVLPGLGGARRSSVSAMKLSPDGQWVATGGESGEVVLRRLAVPAGPPRVLRGHRGWITALDFAPDGASLISASQDGTLRRWKLDAGAEDAGLAFEGHQGAVMQARLLDGGQRLVSAGADATLRVWKTDAAAPPLVLRGHEGDIAALALDAGQRWLASGGDDRQLRLWDLQQADPSPRLVGQRTAPLTALAMSRDGRWLAAGDRTGAVRLWDRADLASEPARLRVASGSGSGSGSMRERVGIWGLRFSPDGRWMIAMARGRLHLWRLRLDEQIALACATVGRNISHDLWRAHLEGVPYRLTCPEHGLHPRWLEQADVLAKETLVDEATRMYADALRVDPSLRIDPPARSRALALASLRSSARGSVLADNTDAALALYAAANRLDPSKAVDAEAEIARLKTASKLQRDASELAKQGKLDPAVALFRQAREADPGLDIDPEREARRLWAPALVKRGDELARQGRMDEAVKEYEQAIAHGVESSLDPQEQARRQRAEALEAQGGRLSREGLLDESRQLFEEALRLNPARAFDPAVQAAKGVAEHRLEAADTALAQRRVLDAARLYREALALDPQLRVSAGALNVLCWDGAVAGHAREVLDLCELAVALAPDDLRVRDSRGIARALAGQRDGAIADLAAYADELLRGGGVNADAEARRRVIAQLRRGVRLKSFAELEALGIRR